MRARAGDPPRTMAQKILASRSDETAPNTDLLKAKVDQVVLTRNPSRVLAEAFALGLKKTQLEAAVPASYNDLFTDPEIRDHVGWVYYQRHARVPRGWTDDRILLRFDAATHAARVYVDDALVGEHVGGYTPFDVDITNRVRAGEEFRLTVAVSGDLTNETIPPGKIEIGQDGRAKQTYFHDFYNYAGLARSVWLYSTPKASITDVTVVTSFDGRPSAEGAAGLVDYAVDAPEGFDVRVRLTDARTNEVARADGASGRLRVPDVVPWRPGAGYLYELTAELLDDGKVVDAIHTDIFGSETNERLMHGWYEAVLAGQPGVAVDPEVPAPE